MNVFCVSMPYLLIKRAICSIAIQKIIPINMQQEVRCIEGTLKALVVV